MHKNIANLTKIWTKNALEATYLKRLNNSDSHHNMKNHQGKVHTSLSRPLELAQGLLRAVPKLQNAFLPQRGYTSYVYEYLYFDIEL